MLFLKRNCNYKLYFTICFFLRDFHIILYFKLSQFFKYLTFLFSVQLLEESLLGMFYSLRYEIFAREVFCLIHTISILFLS